MTISPLGKNLIIASVGSIIAAAAYSGFWFTMAESIKADAANLGVHLMGPEASVRVGTVHVTGFPAALHVRIDGIDGDMAEQDGLRGGFSAPLVTGEASPFAPMTMQLTVPSLKMTAHQAADAEGQTVEMAAKLNAISGPVTFSTDGQVMSSLRLDDVSATVQVIKDAEVSVAANINVGQSTFEINSIASAYDIEYTLADAMVTLRDEVKGHKLAALTLQTPHGILALVKDASHVHEINIDGIHAVITPPGEEEMAVSTEQISLGYEQDGIDKGGKKAQMREWLRAETITLPDRIDTDLPFGRVIDRVRFDMSLSGVSHREIMQSKTVFSLLQDWRDNDGALTMTDFGFEYGPLSLGLSGDAALDQQMQPKGALTATIKGALEGIDTLVERGVVQEKRARTLRLMVTMLSLKSLGKDGNAITLPFRLDGGVIYMSDLPIERIPTIDWKRLGGSIL